MAYSPRPTTPVCCAYCARVFAARHARRRYCSKSCNVRASYARTGRRGRLVAPFNQVVNSAPLLPTGLRSLPPLPKPGVGGTFGAEIVRLCHLVEHAHRDSQRRQQQHRRWVDEMVARWAAASPRQRP